MVPKRLRVPGGDCPDPTLESELVLTYDFPNQVNIMRKIKAQRRIREGKIWTAGQGMRVAIVLGFLLAVSSGWAHHGLAAFDTTHTVRLEGKVTEFQWINPHAFIFADLTDDNGKKANWRLELGSLGMLTKYGGWTKTTVKRGDPIRVQGFVAKDGTPYMSVGRVWLTGGRTLEGKP
jgi:hypothetical protein